MPKNVFAEKGFIHVMGPSPLGPWTRHEGNPILDYGPTASASSRCARIEAE